jgi:D-amino-acid dehydrogenase
MKDVVIIGGGIIGCCCAWFLKDSGMNVTIIDKGDFTDGCSFGNSGMIVPSHFTPLASPGMISKGLRWMFKKTSPFYIRPRINLELAQWLWQFYRSADKDKVASAVPVLRDMHQEGYEFYNQLHSKPGFAFDFEKKGIFMMYQTAQGEHEEAELAERAFELGLEATILSPIALKSLERHIKIDARGAVHYTGDAHLAPHLLMPQLIHQLREAGVVFMPGHEVIEMNDHFQKGSTLLLRDGSMIDCKHTVLAAGSWTDRLMKKSGYKLLMQDGKGYSMTWHRPDVKPSVPAILTEARVAITPMGNDLRIAGTLEMSGMDDKVNPYKVKSILKAASSYYPDLKMPEPEKIWYGYRPCTPTGLPYIGRWKKNSSLILATGHAMMGMSLAPATGRIVSEIISGTINSDGIVRHKALDSLRSR